MTSKNKQLIAQARAELVEAAKQALNLTGPAYRIEVKANTVTFYLYGHVEPIAWHRPQQTEGTKPKQATKAIA